MATDNLSTHESGVQPPAAEAPVSAGSTSGPAPAPAASPAATPATGTGTARATQAATRQAAAKAVQSRLAERAALLEKTITASREARQMHEALLEADDTGEIAPIESRLRHNILKMPAEIHDASGIVIWGRRIRSLVYTTDLAIIKNCDADAIFAVYPFTPQQSISAAIISAASVPVFCGIGGGTTHGLRTVSLAKDVECQGAMGVVLNAPITNANLYAVASSVDIPVVITVTKPDTDIADRIRSGASILNVAAGAATPDLVRQIKSTFPKIPIIASGGKTPESIRATVAAGANAITYTPPSSAELFKEMMSRYRE